MDRCRLRRHQSLTAASARAYRPLAVTCLTPFTPFFDLAQIWEKPRKLNVALSVGSVSKLSMQPFQIVFQIGLKNFDAYPIRSAGPLIGSNTLPRKHQVLARVNLIHQ